MPSCNNIVILYPRLFTPLTLCMVAVAQSRSSQGRRIPRAYIKMTVRYQYIWRRHFAIQLPGRRCTSIPVNSAGYWCARARTAQRSPCTGDQITQSQESRGVKSWLKTTSLAQAGNQSRVSDWESLVVLVNLLIFGVRSKHENWLSWYTHTRLACNVSVLLYAL